VADYSPTVFTDNQPPGISAAELLKINNGIQDAIRAWKIGTRAQMDALDLTASRYWAFWVTDESALYVNFDGAAWTKVSASGSAWAFDSEVTVAASYVDVPSLDGNAAVQYDVILDGVLAVGGVARNVTLRPNNVVTSTYNTYVTANRAGGAAGVGPYDGAGLFLGYTWAADTAFAARGSLFAKTGRIRKLLCDCEATQISNASNTYHHKTVGRWDDTTTNIASLRIDFGGATFTGRVRVKVA
jgi:hypothetical protein